MIDNMAITQAASALGGAVSFTASSDDVLNESWYAKVVWEGDGSKPTLAALEAKMDELQADFDAKQYQRDRQLQYLPMGDQLDMQYHDAVDGTTTWKDHVAAVKAANPKP